MKLLRNPIFAVFLCILIVLGSTALSMDKKLSAKGDGVIDSFYNGVRYDGEDHPAIAGQINALCSVAEDMVSIASNYGIKTDTLSDDTDKMEQALSFHSRDIGYISEVYKTFYASVKTTEEALHGAGLSERHIALMEEYSKDISEATESIMSAGYNDSVRRFLQSNDRFPASGLAALFGIQYPAYFQ